MDHNTGVKRFTRGIKYHKDNQLLSLEDSYWLSLV